MRFMLCLLLPMMAYAIHIDDLMHKDVLNPKFIFQSKAMRPLDIQMARVHFLGASSCYEKYMSTKELFSLSRPIVLTPDEQISLDPKVLYQVALDSVGPDEIENVASALIRLQAKDLSWLQFIGGCEDQRDNCCIPIHCHPSIAECVPEVADALQFIKLPS